MRKGEYSRGQKEIEREKDIKLDIPRNIAPHIDLLITQRFTYTESIRRLYRFPRLALEVIEDQEGGHPSDSRVKV
jgi:hypothetical protein